MVIGTIIVVRRMRTSERTYEPRMRAYVRRRGRPTPCAVAWILDQIDQHGEPAPERLLSR